MKRVIYPQQRAVEHATALPDVRPVRIFPVLWPLWQVETRAQVRDEQTYEVIDQFLVRGIAEGGYTSVAELTGFLGLPAPIVHRCLDILAIIGHVTRHRDQVTLTELGEASLRAGIRYVRKESRQTLLVERLTCTPLPRPYYHGAVTVLSTPQVPTERTRFLNLYTTEPLRPEVIHALAHRADRAEYNLPSQLGNLEILAQREGYLPVYLVETARHGVFAYSAVSDGRDTVIEAACRGTDRVGDLIDAEGLADPEAVWTTWLATAGLGTGLLRQLADGRWRVTFPAGAYTTTGTLSLSQLGSYKIRDHHVVQLWCQDAALRRRAVLERALNIAQLSDVRTTADLQRRITQLATALEVSAPTIDAVRQHASSNNGDHRLGHLDALTATS